MYPGSSWPWPAVRQSQAVAGKHQDQAPPALQRKCAVGGTIQSTEHSNDYRHLCVTVARTSGEWGASGTAAGLRKSISTPHSLPCRPRLARGGRRRAAARGAASSCHLQPLARKRTPTQKRMKSRQRSWPGEHAVPCLHMENTRACVAPRARLWLLPVQVRRGNVRIRATQ